MRLVRNVQFQFRDAKFGDLNPLEVITAVEALLEDERLKVVRGGDELSIQAQKNATLLFSCLVRSVLSSRRALEEFKLSANAFSFLLDEIKRRFAESVVQPGEVSYSYICAPMIGKWLTKYS